MSDERRDCLYCGEPFTPKRSNQAYCCRQHMYEHKKILSRERRTVVCDEPGCGVLLGDGDRRGRKHYCAAHKLERRTCAICGTEYESTRGSKSHTCGKRECATESRRRGKVMARGFSVVPYAHCDWCGAVFVRRRRDSGQRFCCPSHHSAYANWTRYGGSSEPLPWRTCAGCGTTFYSVENKRFCTEACEAEYTTPSAYKLVDDWRPCKHCGELFETEYNGGKRPEFCCPEHQDAHRKQRHRELMATDPDYAARNRAAKKARKFSLTAAEMREFQGKIAACRGRCPDCGRRVTKANPWSIDHYHPRSRGGDDDIRNYRPLCTECNCWKKRDQVPNVDYFPERAATGQIAIAVMA